MMLLPLLYRTSAATACERSGKREASSGAEAAGGTREKLGGADTPVSKPRVSPVWGPYH